MNEQKVANQLEALLDEELLEEFPDIGFVVDD